MKLQSTCTCFIVPSKLLRKAALDPNTPPQRRDALLRQIELFERIRGQRSATPVAAPLADMAASGGRRTIYDARHKTKLPGTRLFGEDHTGSVNDQSAKQAFDGAGVTREFYKEVHNRNSIDGHGLRLNSTVHYDKDFNNAFWNGRQMVYGDGDGQLFSGFTKAIDVIGHELTHGVTQYTVPGGGLDYEGQSGALNESISDVFGSLVKQYQLKQTADQADWLIGAGIFAPGAGKALRSMADPGNRALTWDGDDQPKHMSNYVEGGDVHTNSGIPNHAFYQLAMQLGGHAWDKAGKIWYKALSLLTPTATFEDAAKATSGAAVLLYGEESPEHQAVLMAWEIVGVPTS